MGELEPFYGKWNWPLREMQPGMYFVVDHARRDPEAVRSYVSMYGSRLGKYFSINADDPERPGYCRVTCVPPPSMREEKRETVMDVDKVHAKVAQWYGVALNDVLPWSALALKQKTFIAVEQVDAPPIDRLLVRTALHDGWFGLVFKPEGMEFHPLPAGTSLKGWKREAEPTSLDEIMQ